MDLHCIDKEMLRFGEIFEEVLHTNVPLAENVIRYFLDKRGKQLRPVLTLLSAKIVAGEVRQQSIYGAVAVELLHNASLMHDDVVDESAERRGRATINNVWGNKVAVLTGDFFLAKCLLCSNLIGSLEVSKELGLMVTALSEGELEQLSNAQNHLFDEEAYYRVIKGKTASLFAACLRIGARSVGASSEEIQKMHEIGEKIGMIFQIRDDIFDYYPQTEEVGKPTGHDIMEGKVTLPLLYAFQHAPEDLNARMRSLLINNNIGLAQNEVETLVEFAKEMGGIEYAQKKMLQLSNEAKEILVSFPESEARETLLNVIDYFVSRNS
ncbi:MAG: polyprenyl synthetase family protein [Bacteroidales bacterium]|nr:polyprenyl synthetase family protein [Bacteroidales bacterium]